MAPEIRRYDTAAHLRSPQEARLFLEEVAKDGDPVEIAAAIETVARARGMMLLAEETGVARDTLFDAINAYPAPNLAALDQVLDSLGLPRPAKRKASDAA